MIESKCGRCGWVGVTISTCPDCSTPESRAEAALAASSVISGQVESMLQSCDGLRAILEWAESDVWMDLGSHVRFNVSSLDAEAYRAILIIMSAAAGVTHEQACRDLCRILRAAVEQAPRPELEPVLEVGESLESRPGWTQHVDPRFGDDGLGMWRQWGRDTYVSRCGDGSGGFAWGIFSDPHGGCSKGVWKTPQEAMKAAELREETPAMATSYVQITGAVMRDLREAKGLTQSQVARHAGLKHSAWSRIEHGQVSITVEQVAQACALFGVTLGAFFAACDDVMKECLRLGLVVSPSRLKGDEDYVNVTLDLK